MRQAPSYENFDVLLERMGEGVYRARVVHAPAGQGARVVFTQPFAPLELENFLLRIGRPRLPVRRVDAPETRAIKDFGERLYRALFHDDLRVSLERSLSEAAAKGAGLRLRLRLSDTPELAELPWEFLYDKARNRFVCLSDRTPLVRFLEVPDPPRPLPVSPPLRILVMISSPHDPRFAQLDVEQEWGKLHRALGRLERAGLVRLERLQAATLPVLRQRLRQEDWHVLHFIGHGGFNPSARDGVVVLENAAGGSQLVGAQALGVPLHNHDPLRLVVLNACEGARADPTDPFAGTAQTLIQQGIPAVVAMQFEITDLAAIALTSELYGAVADGYPLDAALSQARQAIYTDVSEIEWATPVLYLRAPDGRIFDVASTPPAVTPPPAASTTTPMAPTKTAPAESPAAAGTAKLASAPAPPRPAADWSSKPVRTFLHPSRSELASSEPVNAVAFSPDARWLATASDDKTARIWEISSGEQLHSLTHTGKVRSMAFGPDGSWLATGSGKTARTWDTRSGQQLQTIALPHDISEVQAVASSPDGRWLATSFFNSMRIWDARSGKKIRITALDSWGIEVVAFSPDARWLATGSFGSTRIWDTRRGKQLRTLTYDSSVKLVAFSPDGRRLATSTFDGTTWIWEISSGELLHTLIHDRSGVEAVAFSPDGRWLAAGSFDSTRIWDTGSGEQLHTITRTDDLLWVRAVAFSPDGRWLAAGTSSDGVVLWELATSSRQ
jgi:CHAT domain/WD domain, G-beta repeat